MLTPSFMSIVLLEIMVQLESIKYGNNNFSHHTFLFKVDGVI